MDRQTWQGLFLGAIQAHQQSRLAEAAKAYIQLLQVNPYHADTLHLLGIVYSQQGKHAEAITYINQAIRINPESAVYYNNLGEVYSRKGETGKAIRCYLKAIRLLPGFAEALFNLANAHKLQGNLEEAVLYYKNTLKLNPTHVKAQYNLGNALLELGNIKSAMECYKQVISLQPGFAEAHNNLGITLQEWDDWEQATSQYQQALTLKTDFTEACRNLANALETQGKTEEARQYYRNMVRKNPADVLNSFQADSLSPVIFSSAKEILQYRKILRQTLQQYSTSNFAIELNKLHENSIQPSANLIYQGADDRIIKEKYAALFEKYFPHQPATAVHKTRRHIGFVVTSGHEGVFLKCMRGILNHLPGELFQLTVVCSAPNGEKILRPAILNPEVHYLSIPKRFDLAVQQIRKASFDVLYYWEVGTDVSNYFLPFCRLAPVQCTSWGWPITSGISQMDYFISCALLETAGSEQYYTEKLIQLSRLPVYYYYPPIPQQLKSRQTYNLPASTHLYLCTQNLRKVHPDFDQIVAKILWKDPMAVVVFIADKHPSITQLLRDRLYMAFPDLANRIYFLPRMPEETYLNLVSIAEVILDTLYYGGGANTCYDAFAVGTPVITLPTIFHRGRFAYAAYQQMDIQDCIAWNVDEYVEKAVRIATQPEYRMKISYQIKAANPAIFEDKQAVVELSAFLLEVIEKLP